MNRILDLCVWRRALDLGAIAGALLAFSSLITTEVRADEREGLVLLVNRNVPESLELARDYCRLRELPEERICPLDLPTGEAMDRKDYEQRLRDPLLEWLRKNGWIEQIKRNPRRVREHETAWTTIQSRLRMICSFYGVPVRIEDTKPWVIQQAQNWLNHAPQRDEAAVDSELALLLYGPYSIQGRFPNPLLGQLHWDGTGAAGLYLVMATRLDGPDPEIVRTMMTSSIEAERYGLHGRAYFDLRASHQDDYQIGDFWFNEALWRLAREGYDCVAETSDSLFDRDYPMDSPAFYFGWYADRVTGPFVRSGFRFQPGALAYHNHSGNAKALRTRDEYWTGPLLADGAAATWGAVREPFLSTTPQVNILIDRLCRGATFAESTYLALAALSWQITVIGDPLYRPFALSLDEQIRKLEEEQRPEVEWAWLRRINLLVREGRLHAGLAYARDRLRVRDSALLHEKMADLFVMNELPEEALPHYEKAVARLARADAALRVGARYLLLLRALGRGEQAAQVEAQLRQRWSGSPHLMLLQQAHPRPRAN